MFEKGRLIERFRSRSALSFWPLAKGYPWANNRPRIGPPVASSLEHAFGQVCAWQSTLSPLNQCKQRVMKKTCKKI